MDIKSFDTTSFRQLLKDNSIESAWIELSKDKVQNLHITSTKQFYNNTGVGTFIMLLEHNINEYFKKQKIKNTLRCYYLESKLDLLQLKNQPMLFFVRSMV